jgi:hypothetical protein
MSGHLGTTETPRHRIAAYCRKFQLAIGKRCCIAGTSLPRFGEKDFVGGPHGFLPAAGSRFVRDAPLLPRPALVVSIHLVAVLAPSA